MPDVSLFRNDRIMKNVYVHPWHCDELTVRMHDLPREPVSYVNVTTLLSLNFGKCKITQYNTFASAYSRRLPRTSSSISKAAKFSVSISAHQKNRTILV